MLNCCFSCKIILFFVHSMRQSVNLNVTKSEWLIYLFCKREPIWMLKSILNFNLMESLANIVCIIGGNCNATKTMSSEMDFTLIWCASHILNIGKHILNIQNEPLVHKVNRVMVMKLWGLLLSAIFSFPFIFRWNRYYLSDSFRKLTIRTFIRPTRSFVIGY